MKLPFLTRPSYATLNEITLSTAALHHNLRFFQQAIGSTQIAPVLKSNAYGHGLLPIAKILDPLQLPFLVVDSLYEAYELYKERIQTPILIMGFTHPDNFKTKPLPFSTVVYDLELVKVLQKHQPQMPLHLKIDTGMNRQGIRWDELPNFLSELQQFPNLKLTGVTTHLADADNPKSNVVTKLQLERFLTAIDQLRAAGFSPTWKHVAASAGALKLHHPEINLIRLGLGLYGISPLAPTDPISTKFHLDELQPVLQLETTLAQIKTLRKGESVGYNHTFTAKKDMTIGVLPIGYYDGIDRRLSNKGNVLIEGVACPILGRVSMNITVVDATAVPQPRVGQKVIVYSNDATASNSIQHAATVSQTLPYELLVHLAESTKRITV